MKIALIGASGFVGSALREAALRRGHTVTALVSHPKRLTPATNLTVGKVDVMDRDALARQLRGQDAVLSAFSGHASQDIHGYYMKGLRAIVAAVKTAGVPRFLLVGGAGSLEVAPGKLLTDAEGNSRVSLQDYAVAMLDELETPRHARQRFSVAY